MFVQGVVSVPDGVAGVWRGDVQCLKCFFVAVVELRSKKKTLTHRAGPGVSGMGGRRGFVAYSSIDATTR